MLNVSFCDGIFLLSCDKNFGQENIKVKDQKIFKKNIAFNFKFMMSDMIVLRIHYENGHEKAFLSWVMKKILYVSYFLV